MANNKTLKHTYMYLYTILILTEGRKKVQRMPYSSRIVFYLCLYTVVTFPATCKLSHLIFHL